MSSELSNADVIIKYVENKIGPYTLNEYGKTNLSLLLKDNSIEDIKSAIDISFVNYIKYDSDGFLIESSINEFLDKIGGIIFNNNLNPIEKETRHLQNVGKKIYRYWSKKDASIIFTDYINALRIAKYSEDQIVDDLKNDSLHLLYESKNWTTWKNNMGEWIKQLLSKSNEIKKEVKIQIFKEYEIVQDLDFGSFGITYLCRDKFLNKYFVLKKFSADRLDENENNRFFNKFIYEISVMYDFHHQNIVNIYDYKIDRDNNDAFYIMEYVDGTSLDNFIKSNSEFINDVFEQLISVFFYLEKYNFCHRDIRYKNILVDREGIVKLIDFGFAKEISNSDSVNTMTKLIDYQFELPSELKKKNAQYDNKTEIYFLGCMFKDLINKYKIKNFMYTDLLKKMTYYFYNRRIDSFSIINSIINTKEDYS